MKKYLLLAGSLLALSACSKKDDVAPGLQGLLTAKPWRISAYTTTITNAGVATTKDSYANMPACSQDNVFTFKNDHTLTVDEGATQCSPATAPDSFAWSFSNDQTQLLVANPDHTSPETNDLLELSATTLRARITTARTNDVKVETITFTSF